MIYVDKTTNIPTVGKAVEILTSYNNKMGIPLDYDRLLEYYSYYTIKANVLRKRVEKYIGYSSLDPIKDTEFAAFLKDAGVTTGLTLTGGGRVSLSGESLESAIATGLYSKELNTLMNLYATYKKSAHKISMFKGIIDSHRVSRVPTFDNHRMIFCRPIWVPQNTGRIGMQSPALMNVAKELADIATVPKGWILMEVDSGQIEPRIIQSAYLRDPQLKKCTMSYNDAYFGYVHYCTLLSDEDIRVGTLDIQAVELSEAVTNKRKKFKTFGNAVMYGSTENEANDSDKGAFIRRIGGHPNRVAWQSDVEEQVERGQRVFYTAFGTPIDITKGPSESNYPDKTSKQYFNHLVRCAINNPIQGTAADLMRLSILRANHILLKKAPNSVILKYTHDSGTFAINESEYDKVIDELKEITSYQVEDWIPIYGDPVIGRQQTSDLPRLY